MNRAIKKLLSDDKRALMELHNTFGFDWTKPYQAFYIKGNTTLNKILSNIEHDENTLVIALTTNFSYINTDEWRVVEILDKTTFNIEFTRKLNTWNCKLNKFYTKGEFKEAIKNPNSNTIVIAQKRELLTPIKRNRFSSNNDFDLSQRYRLKTPSRENEYYSYRSYDNNERYVNHIDLIDIHTTGKKITYHVNNVNYPTVESVIDKSGYLLPYYQIELKNKAHALRAKRKKEAYLATDNTEKIEQMSIRLKAKKLELIEIFKNANTYAELNAFYKKIDNWNGYTDCVRDFEDMTKKITNKEYSSIESFETAYKNLSDKLLAI